MKRMMSMMAVGALALSLSMGYAFAPEKKDIVDTAIGAGQFKTLVSLVQAAGLVDALRSEGPFTVFAPTDAAFAKVPKATLNALGKDKEALKQVLLYHVVSGKVTSGQVVKVNKAKTLQGSDVKVKVSGKNVMINNAKVVKADIECTNGVIHVMDTVILPPAKK